MGPTRGHCLHQDLYGLITRLTVIDQRGPSRSGARLTAPSIWTFLLSDPWQLPMPGESSCPTTDRACGATRPLETRVFNRARLPDLRPTPRSASLLNLAGLGWAGALPVSQGMKGHRCGCSHIE